MCRLCWRRPEEVLRLLHQFAAGFLKAVHPPVLEHLEAVLQTDAVSSGRQPLVADSGNTDADLEAALVSQLQDWRESQLLEDSRFPDGLLSAPEPVAQPELLPGGAGPGNR